MIDTTAYEEMDKSEVEALVNQIPTSRKYPWVVDLDEKGVFVSAAGLYGAIKPGIQNAVSFESLWHTECHAFKHKQYLVVYDPLHGYRRFSCR